MCCRAFEEIFADDFQRDNPHMDFEVVYRPSKHPFLEAFYSKAS